MLAFLGGSTSATGIEAPQLPPHRFVVLDGDTVLVDGSPFRVAGIDAPELGPWARCWAEAALAGHARESLQRLLSDDSRGWRPASVSTANGGRSRTARLVSSEGFDIADDMIVAGYAAKTDASWDWCGQEANLHHVSENEQPPHGPNLWWPMAHMFDARAAD
jgi:endonuclease YncB( thermonuclease family)